MTALQFPLNVKVACKGGTYTTQTVGSHRASSTSSAEAAMGRLVDRITAEQQLPIGSLRAAEVQANGLRCGVSVWRIERVSA